MTSNGSYQGTRRKLVLAFDVGTTFSGVSYSILDPGQIPQIHGVTRFPGQDQMGTVCKIPTVIYYDRSGRVRAAGAETLRDEISIDAGENGWLRAEWFKLHLRPRTGGKQLLDGEIPPLPPKKTVVEVFADFLRYLLKCTAQFIQESHLNGKELWASTKNDLYFVLPHPNGWGGREQSLMRRASILAGLIPNSPSGNARVSFVTEGEASLHFAIQHNILSGHMKESGVIIVDAGGGTIDLSAYRKIEEDTAECYEEIATPECLFCGSVYVNFYARKFLGSLLNGSPFEGDLDEIVKSFDRSTKPRFKAAEGFQYIKFGGIRDNNPAYNIKLGQLKLLASDVATFFEPSIERTVAAILKQNQSANKTISHVVFVGGFAASDWLFKNVSTVLSKRCPQLTVVRPEERSNKAVAHGATFFFINHYVHTRMSRATYGVMCAFSFNKEEPEHLKRSVDIFLDADGTWKVHGGFSTILEKGHMVSEVSSFRQSFSRNKSQKSELLLADPPELYSYSGSMTKPKWLDMDPDNFTNICQIVADMTCVPVKKLVNPVGKLKLLGWRIPGWLRQGVEKRSPATIVYDHEPSDRASILIKDFKRLTIA